MASTVVIQSKQGIGDVTWNLPYLRAIAAISPGGKIVFLASPSSHAQELLQAEPCVERTLYFESRGPELQRVLHLIRLVAMLRRLQCDTAWFLDPTLRPALAAFLAGIPNRIGTGLGRQRRFITNAGVDRALEREPYHFEWLPPLMAQMKAPFASQEPNLRLPDAAIAAAREKYRLHARPWIVLGLGGSHPLKEWPPEHWTSFIAALRARTSGTVFLIGGAPQSANAETLIAATAGAPAVNACDTTVIDAAALLHEADCFVGPDSGPMNLAASVGTPAYGLFGATRVLTHSRFIHPVLPDDGQVTLDGMRRISPGNVLGRIEQQLATVRANL